MLYRNYHLPLVNCGADYHIARKMSNSDRLDIIIFGATGFTGKRTIPQLTKLIKEEKLALTWGIAGRSEAKLKQALTEMQQKTGKFNCIFFL